MYISFLIQIIKFVLSKEKRKKKEYEKNRSIKHQRIQMNSKYVPRKVQSIRFNCIKILIARRDIFFSTIWRWFIGIFTRTENIYLCILFPQLRSVTITVIPFLSNRYRFQKKKKKKVEKKERGEGEGRWKKTYCIHNIKQVSFFTTWIHLFTKYFGYRGSRYHVYPVHTFRKCISYMRHASIYHYPTNDIPSF